MELRQLRYFVAIAELENFRRAGERLKIAQPALSTQIGLLEKEIGARLFERLPRGVRLSEAGRSFLTDAREILAKLGEARDRARSIGSGETGALRVAFSEVNSTDDVIVESIRVFRSLAPQVSLALLPMPSRSQEIALRDRQVDACFLYLRPEAHAEFSYLPLRADNVFAAIPASHRLAGAQDVAIADCDGEPMIWMMPAMTPRLHDGLISAFASANVTPRIVQKVESATQMLTLVSMGLGIGLIGHAQWSRMPNGIVLRPLRDIELHFSFDLAWHKDNKSSALATLVQTVRNIAAQQPKVTPET
jgi:DNA-binding transcriptional LysR family regulator